LKITVGFVVRDAKKNFTYIKPTNSHLERRTKMALWKPFRGNRVDLDSVEKHDGYIYFCTDDGSLFFDYTDAEGNLQRKQISAKDAETLCGMSLDDIKAYVDEATPRPDWNQVDETKSDFILNKPENIAYIDSTDNENIEIEEDSIVDSALSTISSNPVQNRVVTNAINQLSEEKADKEFVVSIFEQLKALIETGKIDEVIAVLDEAILDLAVLA
jgi:hypothetical protein